MRSYKRDFVKGALQKEARRHVETRDAIIWAFSDIPEDSKVYVKVQGSNELVTAHFPRNMREKPTWLRIGNAVQIGHRGGVRGYITVIGEGRAIPHPIVGSALPPVGFQNDAVLSGMVTTATNPVSDAVIISDGTYRINGIIYSYTGELGGYIVMDDPAPMVMGEIPIQDMGISSFSFEVYPPPPLNYFRYDIIVIDATGTVSVVMGTQTTGVPVMPTTPLDTVRINWILRVGGDIGIPMERIGATYTARYAAELRITAPELLTWNTGGDTKECNVSFTIYDQYGRAFSAPSSTGWLATFEKPGGIPGEVYSGDSGWQPDVVTQVFTGSSYTFKYRRDQLQFSIDPMLFITVEATSRLFAAVTMELEPEP